MEKRTSELLLYSRCLPVSVCESALRQPKNGQTCSFFHCLMMNIGPRIHRRKTFWIGISKDKFRIFWLNRNPMHCKRRYLALDSIIKLNVPSISRHHQPHKQAVETKEQEGRWCTADVCLRQYANQLYNNKKNGQTCSFFHCLHISN